MNEENKKKKKLKEIIRKLHEGADISSLKLEFKAHIGDISPEQISKVEEELIQEGMPAEKIHRLCDLHLSLMKETLDKQKIIAKPGTPIYILMEEHKRLIQFAEELKSLVNEMEQEHKNQPEKLNHIEKHFKAAQSHYIREENVLFPYLEKHGIKQPPKMMWIDHDIIRGIEKKLFSIIESPDKSDFDSYIKAMKTTTIQLYEILSSHFYKENNILFPAALQAISQAEWVEIRKQFDELGYCCFTPEAATVTIEDTDVQSTQDKATSNNMIEFETGTFNLKELETMLNTLPVDITFVDNNDTVRYFSDNKERIFPRAKAVIGRKVQNCHPQKSVHIVNKILDDFRKGTRDKAEFWINLNQRLIYIRYFPLRNQDGQYLGCLEVSQDITEIKNITGERRLLEE